MRTSTHRVGRFTTIVLSIFVFLFLAAFVPFLVFPPLEIIFHLLFGWLYFITETIPRVKIFWPSIITGVFAFLFVLLGTHSSIKWFKANRTTGDSKSHSHWKFRWSLVAVLFIVIVFIAGITMVGIVHQLYWFSQDRSSFRHDEYFGKIVCINHLEAIRRAKLQWVETVGAKDGDPVDVDGVNQYLDGKKTPTCPNGGEYVYGRVSENPTCTYTNTRPSLMHQLRSY